MPPKRKTTPIAEKLRRGGNLFASPTLPRIIEVDLSKLRPNPDQPRYLFDEASLRELANSIERNGLIQPISIADDPMVERGTGYIIVAGEHRYRAHQMLGRETIQAIITSGDPAEIAVIENLQRENLHPLEEARALENLMRKHGYTQEEVSKVVGKARNTITSLLRINSLPKRIQDECPTSDISKSALIEIARMESETEQLDLWDRIKNGGGMTVRAARDKKKANSSPSSSKLPTEKVLTAGAGFIHQLRKIAHSDVSADPELVSKLHDLNIQITALIHELSKTR